MCHEKRRVEYPYLCQQPRFDDKKYQKQVIGQHILQSLTIY